MFKLFLGSAFRLEEGRSRSGLVLECSARKANVIIFAPQAHGITASLIVRQAFRLAQSVTVSPLQQKDVRSGIGGPEFLLVGHWNRFESFKPCLCDTEITFLRDSQTAT